MPVLTKRRQTMTAPHRCMLLLAEPSGSSKLVADAGADKEKANNEGATPLHVAAQRNQAVIKWLLDGADKEKANNESGTPLHVTTSRAIRQ